MNGSELALDTNQAIGVLNDTAQFGKWVIAYRVIHLPVPVVGELVFGALNSRHAQENRQRIDRLILHCNVLPIDLPTAELYSRVRMQLKLAGKPIPENDVWVAACCLRHDLPLATSDEHFSHVDGLKLLRNGSS